MILLVGVEVGTRKQPTSTCSAGSGIPIDLMAISGMAFLQRDHRNTSRCSCSLLSLFFSTSMSDALEFGPAERGFSPLKHSSYLWELKGSKNKIERQ
jgi:hypothetical protein